MFKRSITVRFGECDGLGHVNNGTYFAYLEDARMDIFRLFVPGLQLSDWNLIVASTRCDFLAQITYAETITVHTWIGKIGSSSFVVEHAIVNTKGEWVARGQATLLAFDYVTKKPLPLWAKVRLLLESHSTALEGVPNLR